MARRIAKARSPSRQRGIGTRDRLVEAATVLFAETGYHGTDSKKIAARAGVAVGSFYSYFNDKKEIFIAALRRYDRLVSERIAGSETAPSLPADRKAALRGFIGNLLEAHRMEEGFYREALLMRGLDPDIGLAMDEQEKRVRTEAYRYVSEWKDELRIKDLGAAAFVAVNAIESVVHSIAFGESDIAEDRAVTELTDMILRYLFADST